MAATKGSKRAKVTGYAQTDLLPAYTNTVRIQATADNVYLDFGFVDAAQDPDGDATVVSRVIMNRSTFETFSQHLAEVQLQGKTEDMSSVILSRCPAKETQ